MQVVVGLAASYALSVVSSFLRPRQTIEGVRANTTPRGASSYGRGIPHTYGTVPVAGNVIWADEIQEVRNEEGGSKKKGTPTVVHYSYFATFAVLIGDGPITGIRRVWMNNKLVIDLSEGAVNSWKYGRDKTRIYLGTTTQEPDPTIEATLGVGSTPAYRGRAYMVFRSLPLKDFGNAIPQDIKIEVIAASGNSAVTPRTELPVSSYVEPGEHHWGVDPVRPVIWNHEDGTGILTKVNSRTGTLLSTFDWRNDPDVNAWWKTQAIPIYPDIGGILDWVNWTQTPVNDVTGDVFVVTNNASRAGIVWIDGDTLEPKNVSYYGLASMVSGFSLDADHMVFFVDRGDIWLVRLGASALSQAGVVPWGSDPASSTVGLTIGLPYAFVLAKQDAPGDGVVDVANDNASGRGWLLHGVSGTSTAYLARVTTEGDYTWVEVSDDPGWIASDDPHTLVYDRLTGTLIVATKDALIKVNADSLAVLDSTVLTSGRHAHTAHVQRTVNGSFWVRTSPASDVFREVATTDFKVLTTVDVTDWGHGVGDITWVDPRDRSFIDAYAATAPVHWSLNLWRLNFGLKGQAPTTLDVVVSDLCTRVGLEASDIDVTDLAGVGVQGYRVQEPKSARDALEELRQVYHFDVAESGEQLVFRRRASAATSFTVPAAHLAARVDGQDAPELVEPRVQEIDLPLALSLAYLDPTNDYNLALQRAQRSSDAVRSVNKQDLTVDVVLTHVEAATAAWRLLAELWRERDSKEFFLPPRYLAAEPTDVVSLTRTSATGLVSTFLIRLAEIELGAGMILKCRGVLHDDAVFTVTRPAAPTEDPDVRSIPFEVPSTLVFANAPAIDSLDDDGGFWIGAGPLYAVGDDDGWPGAAAFRSLDDLNYSPLSNHPAPATFGRLVTALATTDRWTVWDRTGTIEVYLTAGTFADATEQEVLAGEKNLLMIGDEVVGFTTALESPSQAGRYTLSTLLRGRYGTEWAVGAHFVGEPVVLLDRRATLARVGSLDGKDMAYVYRAGTFGGVLADASPIGFTNRSRALLPWSPCDIRVTWSGPTATISWQRRTRFGGQWRDGGVVPLNEASASYQVEILDHDRSTALVTLTPTNDTVAWANYDATFSASFPHSLGTNLGFETGDLTGWTEQDAGDAAVYASDGGLSAAEGTYFVRGGAVAVGWIYQDLDLAGVSPGKIGAGHLHLAASWQQANNAASDLGRLIVEFFDAAGSIIGSLDGGWLEITPEDTWKAHAVDGAVPPATSRIRLWLGWDRESGTIANACFDDIALTLTDLAPGERRLLASIAQISASVGAGTARIGGLAA